MGERFTANQVGSLRRYRGIPRFQPPAEPPIGELVSIRKAAQILGMNTSTIHRWLADGFIAGEQVTPGAPWQIRITDELRARIVQQAPPEYLPMLEATMKLGVSRQTVLQRVKRGELEAVLVRQGRRKGLRIKVVDQQPALFEQLSLTRGQYEATIQEFLQIQIHHPAIAFGDVLLRRCHRLMRRAPGPKPVAVFGKRPVPSALQHLHHRLLDESIQHRRNAKLAHPSVRLRDFHPLHRLRLIGPAQQLFPDGWPVLFQVLRQFLDGHPVHARRFLCWP